MGNIQYSAPEFWTVQH